MKRYVAKSLKGAERMVNTLRKQVSERDALLDQWHEERQLLAKLSADSPQFYNPLDVMRAKQIRDSILNK